MTVVERLAELSSRYRLPAGAQDRLMVLLDLLAQPIAPTAVHAPGEAVDVHVADALAGLELEQVRRARRIADLGAGAGVPGLVLAAALPESEVTLVESAARRGGFLERAVSAMELGNARVVVTRAEAWVEGREGHDLVTARALAELSVVVEYAAPLLTRGGALVAWKGRRDAVEEADGAAAATLTGLEVLPPLSVNPFAGVQYRNLYLYLKVGHTPPRFPRRPGIARKRPIRASGRA
ncbi:MAG: 16S rRNA (guanine(527)-N(7))-methyltransferase RsmG [Actinomycetota bacterium]|nr:16S rRNA (guanine(527)-N(7))-methyltransferase RsmG [Actinomycetota bacterium]